MFYWYTHYIHVSLYSTTLKTASQRERVQLLVGCKGCVVTLKYHSALPRECHKPLEWVSKSERRCPCPRLEISCWRYLFLLDPFRRNVVRRHSRVQDCDPVFCEDDGRAVGGGRGVSSGLVSGRRMSWGW